ncbi:hypothetical protein Taro_036684 [Colocasia esculenta]|uniref:Uncharacterized protein n=1 Tax=Colocasia esculenta TaxID=4460 RepID=A0A843WIJ3_COLES|nr:hypothetical protein [Colocasia esculenta]
MCSFQYRKGLDTTNPNYNAPLKLRILWTFYQDSQKGITGITIVSSWFVPYDKSKSDQDAAQRALDFMYGWFMDPLTQGDYPFSMRVLAGDRLPKFTKQQSELIKGSFDFIGLNYYTTNYAVAFPFSNYAKNRSYDTDAYANLTGKNCINIFLSLCSHLVGVDEFNNVSLTLAEALKDDVRIAYYQQHLQQVRRAMRYPMSPSSDYMNYQLPIISHYHRVDVRGFFAWSLMDNFEWMDGYTVRFGIYYVDYKDGLKRYPKSSTH